MYNYDEKSQKVNIFFQPKELQQFLPPAKAGGFPCRTKMKMSIIFIYFMLAIPPLPKGKGFLATRRLT